MARQSEMLAALTDSSDGQRVRVRQVGARDDKFWENVVKALKHGGRFRTHQPTGERRFCAPWAEHILLELGEIPHELVGPEGTVPALVMEPTTIYRSPLLEGTTIATIDRGYLRVLAEPLPSGAVLRSDPGANLDSGRVVTHAALNVELLRTASGWAPVSALWTQWDGPVCFAWREEQWRIVSIGPP